MSDYTELKRLVDRVLTDRRFCSDENHKALADGVLALIAENKRLEADHDLLKSNALPREFIKACEERDKLRAELAGLRTGFEAQNQVIAGLRKEAERYRWLRDGASIILNKEVGFTAESGQRIYSTMPSQRELDSAIDAAMGKGGEA